MRIVVKAKPGAPRDAVERVDETHMIVSVRERPVRGKANEAIVRLLANYFEVPVADVRIVKGWTSHYKMVEIIT